MPNRTWAEKAADLMDLMKGINDRHGTINCGRVALRLDEHLRDGKHSGLPPVATQRADMSTLPLFKDSQEGKLQIKRSSTRNAAIIERCRMPCRDLPIERLDLSDDNREIIELDIAAEIVDAQQEIQLKQTRAEYIIDDLRCLPRRLRDGSAYGFIFYTWPDPKIGHIANFYVDADNDVFFLDAQGKDPKTWVSPSIPSGYRPEIFYLPSLPPEGLQIKAEKGAHTMLTDFKEIDVLDAEEKRELLNQAEKHALRVETVAGYNLTPARANQLAAAAYILRHSITQPEPTIRAKLFKWLNLAAEQKDLLGVFLLAEYYLGADGKPTPSTSINKRKAFEYYTQAAEINPQHVPSLFQLAKLYVGNVGTPSQDRAANDQQAHVYLNRAIAADPKQAYCLWYLAELYKVGRGVPQQDQATNDANAVELLTNAIDVDPKYARALVSLADMYAAGRGVPVGDQSANDKIAFTLCTRALEADPKSAPALALLAELHAAGRGVPVTDQNANDKSAFTLCYRTLEIDRRNVNALYLLAELHQRERGVSYMDKIKNSKKALELYARVTHLEPATYGLPVAKNVAMIITSLATNVNQDMVQSIKAILASVEAVIAKFYIVLDEECNKVLQILRQVSLFQPRAESTPHQPPVASFLYPARPYTYPASAQAPLAQMQNESDLITSLRLTIKAQEQAIQAKEQTIQTQQQLISLLQASMKRKEQPQATEVAENSNLAKQPRMS